MLAALWLKREAADKRSSFWKNHSGFWNWVPASFGSLEQCDILLVSPVGMGLH